jgi:hypothetical protein
VLLNTRAAAQIAYSFLKRQTMKMTAILSLFLALGMTPLWAESPRRIDLTGTTGRTLVLDESWPRQWIGDGSVRVYLTKRLALEPEGLYMRGPDTGRDFSLMSSVVYDLRDPESRTQPFLIVGAGILWHRETFSRGDVTSSGWTASGGFGVRQFLSDRVFVQGDARLGWGTFFRASFSVGYSFGR